MISAMIFDLDGTLVQTERLKAILCVDGRLTVTGAD
jgi:beta-phosphoglucomutase-like phosphatase (HAD superfamily)